MILSREEFDRIRRHAENEYPLECCGVVLEKEGRPGERRLFPCRNVQDEFHARDPQRYPRDARTAYNVDPKDLLKIGTLESDGYRVRVIYHSHVDAGAHFSETDRQNALLQGEPVYPEAIYVVLSVVRGRTAAAGAFAWNQDKRDFVPVDFPKL